MARLDEAGFALTPYERAACYYTLPRVAPPLSARFVFLFGGLLLAELTVLCVIAVMASAAATYAAVLAVVLTAMTGIGAAMGRSLVNEIRTRQVLRQARLAPDTRTQDDTLPDPFERHTLLRHPGNTGGKLSACTGEGDVIAYFLDNAAHAGVWEVRTPQDEKMLSVHAAGGAGSFAFIPGSAGRFEVRVGEDEVALIRDGGTLLQPCTEIVSRTPTNRTYIVRDGGIYLDGRLVGRVYYIHDAYFLDIEKEHLNEGVLGYFVSLV